DEEQGAIIEPLLNLVEKALNEFLIKNKYIIPSEIIEGFATKQRPPINPDFSNADTLNMLNFMIENIKIFDKLNNVRHKMAHGILIDQKGRWSDHALQNVAILACDVITCLGGNYKELYAIKERLDNAIIEKWTDKPTLEVKNKNYENQIQSPKRKHDDLNFCEMLKFVRDILKEVNETKEGFKQKIMKLALREDEDLIQI
ncbi:5279_t:CDS:2, partial [Cetraspora pellucida]